MNVNETALSFRWRQPGGIIALLFILVTISPATGQTSLDVHVTNIAIAGELSARGLTAAFPHPVMAAITVTDNNGNPILGLADTSRWLAPQDLAEIGIPVSQIWKRLLEYHRDAPSFPSNPDIYQQIPAPLVTEFRQTTPFPTSTMLVMDVSGSMSEELADAKGAARLFVDLLRPIDRAGVVQFSHTIAAFQEFTNDKQKLLAIIDSAKADGATALYDALVYAVQATRRENSRRAIIVYTDGVDISSTLTPTAVIDSARFYSTPIFTISLGNGTNPDTLKRIAKETGGLFFQTHDAVEFKAIYQRIAALIQNFYMLAYSSPDPARNDTWRRLEVTVCDEQKNLGMSTGDYFVPGGPPLRDTDLAVTQFVKTDSFVVSGNDTVYFAGNGETINYRVVVANLGLIEAHNVRVTDFLPDSVRASNFQLPPDGANVDSVLWTITRLPPQSSTSFTFNATVAPKMPVGTNLLINRATVKADNEDPAKLANNTSIDTVFNIIKSPAIADLALAFNSRTNSTIVENGRIVNAVKPGEPIDYKIRVRNLGPEQAGNIRVRQLLPDSVRFVAASKSLAVTSRDSLIWQIPSLTSGGVDSITISVLFAARVPPTLTRLISRANLTSPNDNSPANNAASDTVRVVIPPAITDLALTFNSRTNSTIIENGRIVNAVKPGEPIDYKIRVRNLGPEQAGNIRVRQLLPDSVRFVSASKPLAITNRDSVIWQIPSLASGGVDSITISVLFAARVPPTLTQLISRANLTSPNDNSPANNAASDTVRVVIPPAITDLALTFNSRTNSTIVENGRIVNAVKPGEPIDYKIRVRNLGPEQAGNIRVRQLLPDSVRFVAASKSLAVTSRDSLIWQIPSLNSGGVDSITISVLFAARVPPTLTRLISHANLTSPNDNSPANNFATDTVRVVIPPAITDLALAFNSRTNSTIVENGRIVNAVKPGEPIDYKIRVRNLGPEQAGNIRVRQLLPDSVRFVAASKALAVTSRDSLIWQIPSLNSGGVDSITISVLFAARVPPTLTRLISRANLTSPNDNSPANNAASDTVRVVIPPAITDLALAFNSRTNSTIVENGRIVNAVKPGEPIDYKIRVRNLGPEQAGNIRVRQLLPDSVRFVAASKSLAVTSRDSLIWQIPSLTSGGVDSITISVLFAARVPPTLTRLISRANLTSPNDVSPANNSASDTVRVVIPPPLPPTDLAVALASQTGLTIFENGRNVNAAKPGQRYDYRLRVRNFGPAAAENIRLRQSLPDSVRFIAASKPPALATRDSLIWEITSLNAGGSDSINVSVQFAPSVPQNLARLISRLTLFAANDNSPNNNVARDTVRVVIPPPPGSRPLIEARPPEVTIGDSVRVRVQVPAPIVAWDLWVYYANGQIDSSYAEAYIKTTRLAPNVWFDVAPVFTNTRLFTAAKEEEIRFEIRSRDIFGEFTTASDAVLVRSSNDLVLDRNVYEADRQSPLGINFRLSSNREARLEVYDLNGVCITKLVEAPFNAGWNTYNWNGQTETGRPVGSGVYIIALRSGEFNAWKKCIIVR